MAAPLLHEEGALGVLSVLDRPEQTLFSLQEMELLGLFANQAAIAVDLLLKARERSGCSRRPGGDLEVVARLATAVDALEDEQRERLRLLNLSLKTLGASDEARHAPADRAESGVTVRRPKERARTAVHPARARPTYSRQETSVAPKRSRARRYPQVQGASRAAVCLDVRAPASCASRPRAIEPPRPRVQGASRRRVPRRRAPARASRPAACLERRSWMQSRAAVCFYLVVGRGVFVRHAAPPPFERYARSLPY